jgi:RHS repeat-associated protein
MVSDSGVASYTIPLTLPDGASGHRPDLSFVYNSTAGDGVLGRGWSLGGMSAISVCEPSNRIAPIYQGGPGLCLDGEPLRVKQQSGSTALFTGLYESGYIVKGRWHRVQGTPHPFPSAGDAQEAHAWVPGREFSVHHEDGRTLYYGHATDDEFLLLGGSDPAMGPSNIRQWLLRRVTDRFGNVIEYRYQKAGVTVRAPELYDPIGRRYVRNPDGSPVSQRADAEAVLRWIGYNGGSAEVSFHYVGDDADACNDPNDPYCQLATDLHLGRFQGGPLGRLMVLSRVDVRVSAVPIRSYGLGYTVTKQGGIRLLKTLQECGYVQGRRSCAPPLKFEYGEHPDVSGKTSPTLERELANRFEDRKLFERYALPHTLVFDADGDGRDDFLSFGKDGVIRLARFNNFFNFEDVADGKVFPTFFHYKPKEGDEPWYAKATHAFAAPITFGATRAFRWAEEEGGAIPISSGVETTDINRDGLMDIVVWGIDPAQHVNDREGSLDNDCGGRAVLCGSRPRRHHFKATYPLGVWVYQASMQDGKLSYAPRRLLQEGFLGDTPGLAAMLPGIEGKDYLGFRVNNNGAKAYPNAAFAMVDHNDDGQLDFLYCSNHEGGYGILVESSTGLIHPDVPVVMGLTGSDDAPDYRFTLIPGLPVEFCLDAQEIRTRHGRTDLWSPTQRLVLTAGAKGPVLFKETTFGDLDFKKIAVRQIERNGDGLPDLAFHREGTEELEFWLNTGTGFVEGHALGFQPASTLKHCDYKFFGNATIADFDGNGLDDLVIPACGTGPAPGALVVHYVHPTGMPVESRLDGLGYNGKASAESTPYAAWAGDFDGDGAIDVRFVSARWDDEEWRYERVVVKNTAFAQGTPPTLLARVHSTPVAGKAGTQLLISYVAGNGSRHEEGGNLDAACDANQGLSEVEPRVADHVEADTGREGERAAVYSRTTAAGGCALGGLVTCASRLPFPVVASYVERTADLTQKTSGEPAWADCSKTQMSYENGKQDSHQGFVGFERVTRRDLVPDARRSVEVAEFDLSAVPLPYAHVPLAGEPAGTPVSDFVLGALSRLYVRPFAGLPRTQWVDEAGLRTTETDHSRALLRLNTGLEQGLSSVIYAQSRLPRMRAISNPDTDFWGTGVATAVPNAPLMLVPVVRQERVFEGGKPLNTSATWWLRNGSGFVDNELSFSARTSSVEDVLAAIPGFATSAARGASGDLDHEMLRYWFLARHDVSAVGARLTKQAEWPRAPKTWEGRIGLFALQGSEIATTWARPVKDGRQDVRRTNHRFVYDENGALRSTTEDHGDGSSYTYTITTRASTGAVTGAIEWATDAWSSLADSKSWSFEPDDYGLYTVATTNPYRQVSATRFDYASGQPVQTQDVDGIQTLASYDAFGRLASETVRGAETTVSYAWLNAAWGNAHHITVPVPGNPTGVSVVEVNASYIVRETTLRNGVPEITGETWFDPAGRVVRTAQLGPLGNMVWTERVYDSRGRLTVQTRPHVGPRATQGAIVFTYDSLDRLTRITRPNDNLDGTRWVETEYGSIGRPGGLWSWLSEAEGRVRGVRQYTSDDQRGSLVRAFDADGRLVSSLEFDPRAMVTPMTTYEYGLGEPMVITGPDGATLRTDYDVLGRAVQITDPSAGTSSRRFDGFGRLREARDNSTLHRIDYDRLDRPLRHARTYEGDDAAFGANKTTTWQWDALPGEALEARNIGKLLRVSDDSGYAETYTYGGPFALQDSVTRTVPRPSASPLALETRYEYDLDGRLEVLRHPGAQRAQTFRYNARGALTGIDATTNGATATIWELEKVYEGHLPSEVGLLQGKQSRTYYAGTGALAHLSVSIGQTALVDETLRYNESGLLEEHVDLANGKTESFFYDRFRRLEETREGTGKTGPVLESFRFSSGGRIEQKNGAILSHSSAEEPTRWPDAVKRLQRGADSLSYGYHSSYGLMTSIRGTWEGRGVGLDIAYDVDRNVREVEWDSGVTRTLGYSPTGDRASMHETGADADSFVAYAGAHYERAEVAGNVVHVYRFTDGEGNVLVEERVEEQTLADGTTLEQSLGLQHLARDYRGSVSAILPQGGEVTRRTYEAFGTSRVGAGTDLGFTGHRHLQRDDSPLGLVDMGGRMFDPLSAQFTRADPFMPGADSPKGFNRLAYVKGDPINFIDPTGFWGECNPATGGCGNPLPPTGGGSVGGGGGGQCDGRCAKRSARKGLGKTGNFFKTITGVNAIQDRREEKRRDKRFRKGRYQLQSGGAAPNTSTSLVDRAISAVDQYHLRAFNAVSQAVTGAGDFATMGTSAWVRDKLFGQDFTRTDTAAAYVGAGAGFAIGGGVQAIRAIPGAVRAIPGVVGAVRGAMPGILSAAKTSVGNFIRSVRARGAGRVLGKMCFAPGTQVLMADGTTKAIEDVEVGDLVMADNPEDDEPPRAQLVTEVHENATYRLFRIAFGGGVVEATGRHPFFTQRGWIAAEELSDKDWLLDAEGRVVDITSISVESRDSPTFNLTVDQVHTYYVVAGNTPVLVHNVDPWDIMFTQGSFGATFAEGPLAGRTLESVAVEARALGRLPDGLTLNAVRTGQGWATLNNRTLAVARMANLPHVHPVDAGAKGFNKFNQLLRNSGLSGPVQDAVMRCK